MSGNFNFLKDNDIFKSFYNACVEVNNYTPILFEDIKKSIEGDL